MNGRARYESRDGIPLVERDGMLITAAICTHNRARLLEPAIASLTSQTLAPDQYEILVVDNASTDHTCDIVQEWIRRCASIRYLTEPRLGVSYARNRATAQARAPIIAFLDDDARAAPTWLAELVHAFEQTPRPAAVGGPISLTWEGDRAPAWLSRHLAHQFGLVDHGATRHSVAYINHGSNMAIDRQTLLELGGFSANLGRRGEQLRYGEEDDLMRRLRARGMIILYEPRARVDHLIPADRQRVTYILRSTFGKGFSLALAFGWRARFYHGARLMGRVLFFTVKSFVHLETNWRARLVAVLSEVVLLAGFIAGTLAPRGRTGSP